jgi:hypothetical protein
VVARAVGDAAVVSLIPAPPVSLGVAEFPPGFVGDAEGALARGVAALRVVVLGPVLPGLLALLLRLLAFELAFALLEVRPGRADMERGVRAVDPLALRALAE